MLVLVGVHIDWFCKTETCDLCSVAVNARLDVKKSCNSLSRQLQLLISREAHQAFISVVR